MILTTYNLWHGLNAKGTLFFEGLEPETRTQLRYEWQLKMFQASASDVLFLQEVNPLRRRTEEIEALGFEVFGHADNLGFKIFGGGLPWNLESGVAIAIRKPCLAHFLLALKLSGRYGTVDSPFLSFQTTENRYAVLVEGYFEPIGKVLLVVAHLHHGPEWTDGLALKLLDWAHRHQIAKDLVREVERRLRQGDERRKAEISLLLRTLDPLKSRYQAVVLAGDLNLSPGSSRHQQLLDWGFKDPAGEREDLLTFDGRNNENHLLTKTFELPFLAPEGLQLEERRDLQSILREHDQRPRRIDYVLVFSDNESLKMSDAKLVKAPAGSQVELSDHYGLSITLKRAR